MTRTSEDLHGNAPDKSPVALLIIDMINDMSFDDGPALLEYALPAARNIARLRTAARAAQVPIVYVNDNFGRWQSNFSKLVAHCLRGECLGRPMAELLQPDEQDYFVLKPKHSGFFHTPLEILLDHLGAQTLVLTGITADICVLFTANDAYMRDYRLFVPRDCVAAVRPKQAEHALELIERILKADTRPSSEIDLAKLTGEPVRSRRRVTTEG